MPALDSIKAKSFVARSLAIVLLAIFSLVAGYPSAARGAGLTVASSYAVVVRKAVEPPRIELLLAVAGLRHGWLEATSMTHPDLPPRLWLLEPAADAVEMRLDLPAAFSDQVVMLCRAAEADDDSVRGVLCEQPFLQAGDQLLLSWTEGAAVTGTYLFDRRPIAGVRVAAVPAGLGTLRPFTMPLRATASAVRREVWTDADGSFRLPPLGPGEYLLEALLPSGRIHRGDPFVLAPAVSLRAELGLDGEVAVARDLGVIYVDDALAVEILARDAAGQSLAGVRVEARQGRQVFELRTFEGETDAEGRLGLSGFELDLPATVICRRDGYLPVEQEFEQIPARVTCALGRPAMVRGRVLDGEGLPLAGARVSLAAGDSLPIEVQAASICAGDGKFELTGLKAGEGWLWLSAGGQEIERREISLVAGETVDVGDVRLLLASQVQGVVRAASSGEPLAGINVRVLEPPGAKVLSDADGAFALSVPRLAGVQVEAAAEGWVTLVAELTAEASSADQPLTLALDRAGWLGVEVEYSAGRPCQGCRLELAPIGEQLLTDGEGVALSGPLAAGEYRLYLPQIDHLGSAVIEQRYAKGARARVVAGEVTALRLKLEEQPFEVRLTPSPTPLQDGLRWLLGARRGWQFERRHPRADGSFELDARAGQVIELALLGADPKTGAEAEIRIGRLRIAPGQDSAEVELSSSWLEGRVEIDGEPAVGKTVWLISLIDLQPWARVGVATDGSFHIPHALPGIYSLRVDSRPVDVVRVPIRGRLKLNTYQLPAAD